jgi:hypothetical protein
MIGEDVKKGLFIKRRSSSIEANKSLFIATSRLMMLPIILCHVIDRAAEKRAAVAVGRVTIRCMMMLPIIRCHVIDKDAKKTRCYTHSATYTDLHFEE